MERKCSPAWCTPRIGRVIVRGWDWAKWSSMSGQRSPELVPREQGRGLQVPSQTQPTKPRQAFVPPL